MPRVVRTSAAATHKTPQPQPQPQQQEPPIPIPRVEDSSYLRTIPEDRSDVASSSAGGGGLRPSLRFSKSKPSSSVKSCDGSVAESDDCGGYSGTHSIQSDGAQAILAGGDTTETDSVVAEAGGPLDSIQHKRQQSPNHHNNYSYDSTDSTRFWTRRKIGLVTAATILSLGVLSAIVAVVLTDPGGRNGSENGNTTAATGDGAPLTEPLTALDAILSRITSLELLLNQPTSPQYQARQWLAHHDDFLWRPEIWSQGPDRVLQRYALVTFYYATGGPYWNTRSSSDAAVVEADVEEEESSESDTNNENADVVVPFLQPTLSECDWTGVTCGDKLERRRRRHLLEREHSVVRLFFHSRNLTGQLPALELAGGLPTCAEVDWSNNQLQGTIPATLFTAWSSMLQYLDVSGNQFTGTLPHEIGNCRALDWLDLSSNRFSGSIPSAVWSLPELRFLYLSQNRFTGRIERTTVPPTSQSDDETTTATTTSALKQVLLFNNSLTGPLPTWFSELQYLEYWVAFHNQLSGGLPDPPTQSLTLLDLSYNQLTGTLPISLWTTARSPPLINLTLNDNQFSGPLPNATIFRQTMVKLWLHNNQLTGRIPEQFAMNWRDLIDLRIQGNPQLTGQLGPRLSGVEQDEAVLDYACSEVWPHRVTFVASCLEYLNNVPPPVWCDCCTDCV